MHWITRSSGAVFSIKANQRVAGLISVIATALARGDSVGGVGDLIGVLEGLDRNPALREQLLALFAREAFDVLDGMLPDDAYDDLLTLLRSPEMRRRLPDLRLLGCHWDQIGSAACSGLEPRIRWHGLDRFVRSGDVASAPLAALSFDIGAHAARALVLEPIGAADVPDAFGEEVRALLRRGLRLTLTGEAKAGAGIEIPIRFGVIGIGGESAGSARMDFYVDRGSDALIANSFAAAVGSLGNPFDLHAIEQAFAAHRLRAVRIEAAGSVGLNGALTVGLREKLFAATGGLDATLGTELRFHTARRGDYLANLYPAFPADAHRREVRLDIHRLRSREDSASLALGLTLDLTPVLNDLGEALVDKADEAKLLLRRFTDFIPPSAAIRKGLDDRLEAQLSTEHRRLLADLLGSSADASAIERLSQRLAEGLDRQAAVWGEQVGQLAEQVAAAVVGRLLLPVAEQQAMRQIAAMAVETGLEHARGALRERIEQDLTNAEDNALLAQAFSLAGERGELGLDRLDEIAGRIGGQLDRLQGTVAKLAKALRESSETKLRARWRVQETRSRSTSVQQSLLFRPGIGGAAELFQQAMTGSLETLFDRLRGNDDDSGDDNGEPVSLIAGSLQEFAGVRRESGMELALLDFDLSDSHIMEAGVTIETDAAGNISICSRSRSRGRRSRLGGYTEHEVVNSFELAAAQQTRRMSLSLTLSQVEHELEPGEAKTFFDGFAKPDFRLLTRAQIDGAIAAMPDGVQRRRGELRAWLELDAEGLTRLLRLPLDLARRRTPGLAKTQQREVFEVAIDALVAGLQFSGARAKWRNLRDHVKDKLDREDLAVVLKETFDDPQLARLRPSSHTDPREGPRFRTVEEIIGRARSLVRLVGQMRAVYLSDGIWSLREYLARQEDIGKTIGDWYKGEGLATGVGGLMSSKVGPFSLALFKAISDLCASGSADRPPLMASIVVERDGVEAEIPLLVNQPVATAMPTPPPPLPRRLLAAAADTGSGARPLAPAPRPGLAPMTPTGGSSSPSSTTSGSRRPATPPPVRSPAATATPATGNPATATPARADMEQPPFIYPLDDKRATRTYHSGGRKFNARRRGTSRRHAGCDMLAAKGTPIRAMADGVVRRGPTTFYSGTAALEVIHDRLTGARRGKSMIVRYGEILHRVPKGVGVGKRVQQGQIIAYVGRLNSGSSMLHMEIYEDGTRKGSLSEPGSGRFHRRADVTDPTPILDAAPTWAEFEAGQKQDKPKAPPPPPPAQPKDTIDGSKTSAAVNCRSKPGIDAASAPLFQLRAGDLFHVVRLVSGGPHPYDSRNLWAEISMPGRPTGYAIAHFVKLQDPARLSILAGAITDDDRGLVQIDGDTLNLRASPSMAGDVTATLKRGARVSIAAEHTAPTDMPTRDTWYGVTTEDGLKGYVAAHYIELEAARQPEPEEPDIYTKTLIETDWPGCKEATARQIKSAVDGPEVSRRMAEEDLERVLAMASVFQDAMGKFGVPAAILAGIASRESRCGNFLMSGGWSVNGEDFGVMQVNKHAHPGLSTHDPRGVDHVMEATDILADFMRRIFDKDSQWRRQGWAPRYLLQGAVAAYNFGLDDVRTPERIDIGTTNDDYAGDALTRAAYFYQHPRLKVFFQ